MTYIISVANEKGGVAKTTTVLSLGAALVETGLEVLLVDLDGQANLSLALGIETGKDRPTMVDVLEGSASAVKALRETAIPKLALLPSSSQMNRAERFLPVREEFEMTLVHALRDQEWPYDYILIDCPPFIGAVMQNALLASDLLILPTQAEYFSVNALRNMMTMIRRIRTHPSTPRLTYRLLLTMYDRRNGIHRTMSEQLRATFGVGVLETVIETDTRLRDSQIRGMPIIYHSPKSRSALQYRALAQEILAYVKETTSQPA